MRHGLLCAALFAIGCAPAYQGSARPFAKASLAREPGWVAVQDVPLLRQEHERDCGPAAVTMVLRFWGKPASAELVREQAHTPLDQGVQAGALRDVLRERGLLAYLIEGTVDDLERELTAGRPVVVGLAKPYTNAIWGHYEVVAGLNRARGLVATVDPGRGWSVNTIEGFLREWKPTRHLTLVASPPETAGR
jgi:ABC-type bacteriocin/lantibiotic exporter with double-glycine peptidase domain